ncbi:MAG: TetR/AcrR family transcriptional regulator [Limisphaerales bacterium]
MRVTAETQAATRERILGASKHLLASSDFESVTTRDIARAANIAVGTVFNYFPTKEAIVGTLAAAATAEAHAEFDRHCSGFDSIEEALFAFVAAELRQLRGLRKHLPAVLETILSPLAVCRESDDQPLRASHLEIVVRLIQKHGGVQISPVGLNIYWSLYTGLLQFWSRDKSPRQEDTLALLDHSLEMFVGWLESRSNKSSVKPHEE